MVTPQNRLVFHLGPGRVPFVFQSGSGLDVLRVPIMMSVLSTVGSECDGDPLDKFWEELET